MKDDWYDHSDHLCIGIDGIKDNYKCFYKKLYPKLNSIFDRLEIPYSYNKPFNGYSFNKEFYTLSHQGILNSFFSFQFEISKSFRKKIYKEATILKKLENTIKQLYSLNKEILQLPNYKKCKKQQKTIKNKQKINKKNYNKTRRIMV